MRLGRRGGLDFTSTSVDREEILAGGRASRALFISETLERLNFPGITATVTPHSTSVLVTGICYGQCRPLCSVDATRLASFGFAPLPKN